MLFLARTVNFLLAHKKITACIFINILLFVCNVTLLKHDHVVDSRVHKRYLLMQEYVEELKKTTIAPTVPTTPSHRTTKKATLPAPQKSTRKPLPQGQAQEKRGNPYELTDMQDDHKQKQIKNNYRELRKTYQVPSIEYTDLVNCNALLNNDTHELKRAEEVLKQKPKVPIYDETYIEWTENCEEFKKQRGYITIPLTVEEENFPLAFSISMYTAPELTERLLRAIYQPQNFYCIHIDIKSPLLLHRTIRSIANCFPNVFVASHLDKIKWGDVSVLLPAINCMRDFDRYFRGKWKYFINLTGQEIPLRTNWELVQIAKAFDGSNDIAGSISRIEPDRVKHIWTHRWSKTYQQTIFYDTEHPKPPYFLNLTFFKGELHGLFSQRMVHYIVNSEVARTYLKWCWDSGHPSEHYWNTLNYNVQLKAPGGYEGPLDIADRYSYNPIIRAKHWQDVNYGKRECQGKVVRGICVYGVGDLPWLHTRKELVANKFHLTFHYLAYDCLEQRHRERTKLKDKLPIDLTFYKELPTAKYSRKDGYFSR